MNPIAVTLVDGVGAINAKVVESGGIPMHLEGGGSGPELGAGSVHVYFSTIVEGAGNTYELGDAQNGCGIYLGDESIIYPNVDNVNLWDALIREGCKVIACVGTANDYELTGKCYWYDAASSIYTAEQLASREVNATTGLTDDDLFFVVVPTDALEGATVLVVEIEENK